MVNKNFINDNFQYKNNTKISYVTKKSKQANQQAKFNHKLLIIIK
jgi:hypothetical protein